MLNGMGIEFQQTKAVKRRKKRKNQDLGLGLKGSI